LLDVSEVHRGLRMSAFHDRPQPEVAQAFEGYRVVRWFGIRTCGSLHGCRGNQR
jgi:hypothetical protein